MKFEIIIADASWPMKVIYLLFFIPAMFVLLVVSLALFFGVVFVFGVGYSLYWIIDFICDFWRNKNGNGIQRASLREM